MWWFSLYRHFDDAIKDFITVIQSGIPEPYSFSDLMMHIAWCYELKGVLMKDPFSRDEGKGAFATAFKALPGTEESVWKRIALLQRYGDPD
jgi:hypothetical protein